MQEHSYPTCLPPLACDRPAFVELLVAHWAYVLAIDPRLIDMVPTTTLDRGRRTEDGGFMVMLDSLPLERLRVPQGSGGAITYVPVQYGSFDHYPVISEILNRRLVDLLGD